MVGEVAVFKLGFETGGVRAVPAVAAHDRAGEAGGAGLADQQRHSVLEAGVVEELGAGGHHLGHLAGEVGVGGGALAFVDDLDAQRLTVFDKGVLQAVGVIVVVGIQHRHLAVPLALHEQGGHAALVGVDEAVAEDGGPVDGHVHVGGAGGHQQHVIHGGLFGNGQRNAGEEAAHQRFGVIGHDQVVGVHGLAGVLGVVGDLAAVDDLDGVGAAAGVDLLHRHLDGVLRALAVNGVAAGHRPDDADADDVVLLAGGGAALCRGGAALFRCGSVGCRRRGAALLGGRTAPGQQADAHGAGQRRGKNSIVSFHVVPSFPITRFRQVADTDIFPLAKNGKGAQRLFARSARLCVACVGKTEQRKKGAACRSGTATPLSRCWHPVRMIAAL